MIHFNTSSDYDALIIILTLVIIVGYIVFKKVQPLISSVFLSGSDSIEASAIWVAATQNKEVVRLARGKVDDFPFVYYATVSGLIGGRPIIEITLPVTSPVHIMCLGSGVTNVNAQWQKLLTSNLLEPVMLEGDFYKNFTVYTSKNTQIEIREFFDPSTMAYFADFCQNFDFEVYGNSVFIAVHSKTDVGDTTTVPDDALVLSRILVKQISGWQTTHPETIAKGYNAMDHFLGDVSTLDEDDKFRINRGGA